MENGLYYVNASKLCLSASKLYNIRKDFYEW